MVKVIEKMFQIKNNGHKICNKNNKINYLAKVNGSRVTEGAVLVAGGMLVISPFSNRIFKYFPSYKTQNSTIHIKQW